MTIFRFLSQSMLSTSRNMYSCRSLVSLSVFSLTLLAFAVPARLIPSSQFENAFSHVQALRQATIDPPRRRLQSAPGSKQNTYARDANIAYFIQVSETTAWHLPRLMNRIHHPRNVYAIHFDKKVDPNIIRDVKTYIYSQSPAYKENSFFMTPELITYRGVSMLLNTINAMKLLLDRPESWDYFINISGSDYPLISPEVQRELLGNHIETGFNFVTFSSKKRWEQNRKFRMQHLYVDEALSFTEGASTVRHLGVENPIVPSLNFQYTNSEAWMINSRDFCKFVVSSGYARKMLLTFAFSVESSEHYFSSLLWNHEKFNRTIVKHALRHVIWKHEGRSAGQHPFYIDETAPDGSFTFRNIFQESPSFFIRKFKHANSKLMDEIDRSAQDSEHLKIVKRHYGWITNAAIREHSAKPKLDKSSEFE